MGIANPLEGVESPKRDQKYLVKAQPTPLAEVSMFFMINGMVNVGTVLSISHKLKEFCIILTHMKPK